MKTTAEVKPISLLKSFVIFFIAGILFYITIKILVPTISAATGQTEYIVWMLAGSFILFLPLFVTIFCLLKKDGCKMELLDIAKALNLKPLHKKDIAYIAIGMIIASILYAMIVVAMILCSKSFTISSLSCISPIKVSPLHGKQLWFALFLPVSFSSTMLEKKLYGEAIFYLGRSLPDMGNSQLL